MSRKIRFALIFALALFFGGHLAGFAASAALGADVSALLAGAESEPEQASGITMELVRQIPAVLAIIYLVGVFLKHIAASDKSNREERLRSSKAIDERADECHAVQREVSRVLHENTTTMKELRRAIERDHRPSTPPKPPEH